MTDVDVQESLRSVKARAEGAMSSLQSQGQEEFVEQLRRKVTLCGRLEASGLTPLSFWSRSRVGGLSQEEYQQATKILLEAEVISEPELFRQGPAGPELVPFPDVFISAKREVLGMIEQKLASAKGKQWAWEARQVDEHSFARSVYSRERFMQDAAQVVQEEERVRISESVGKKLAGKLDHEAFLGHGPKLRNVLEEEVHHMARERSKLTKSRDLAEKRLVHGPFVDVFSSVNASCSSPVWVDVLEATFPEQHPSTSLRARVLSAAGTLWS